MAIIHFVNRPKSQTKAGMLFTMRYTMRDEKTVSDGKKLVTGINCTPTSAYTQFKNTKLLYGKDNGRQYYHFVQSFPVGENITPELAHEIALRFINETEKFRGFEIIAATHCDRNHTHTHFVLNSVNAENGLKFHIEQKEIDMLMRASDKIISEYGLSICVPDPKKPKYISDREYRTLEKKESWKLQLAITVDNCMKLAKSKKHFKWLMEQEGYGVKWTDERKNITYTTPDGNHCRDNKLHDDKYLKGNMEYEFRIRAEVLRTIQTRSNSTDQNGGESRAFGDADRAKFQGTYRSDEHAERMAGEPVADARSGDDRGRYANGNAPTDSRIDESKSESTDEYAGYFRINKNGEREYILTGWENERDDLLVSQRAEGADSGLYEKAVMDYDSGKLDLLIDGAYLAADISNLIDDDGEIIDCTTTGYGDSRQKKEERMKRNGYTGPVMGGM